MRLLTHRPGPPLAQFVDVLWLCQREPSIHAKERVLPTGTVELVIDLREGPHVPLVSGPHSESFVIDTEGSANIVGVHFRPGGAFPFLNLPAGDLHNAQVPLGDLWGHQATKLRDRLLESKTPAAQFQALEEALMEQAKRPLERHPAVDFALNEFQSPMRVPTVSDVLDEVGLSHRRFIEVFRNQVGFSPKLYCRIQRFQRIVQCIGRGRRVDWTHLAVECGYYDQAHFIRDFRAFSGIKPSTYSQLRAKHPYHVPVCD